LLRIKIERLKVHPLAESLIPPLTDEEYTALVLSISRHGIIKPLDVVEQGEGYLVIDGCHRLRAAKELGLKRVPVNVMVFTSDEEIAEYILTLQSARRNLTPAQKAAIAVEWMERTGMDIREAAGRFGVAKKRILEIMAIKKKEPEFYEIIRSGAISSKEVKEYSRLIELDAEHEPERVKTDAAERVERLERERDKLLDRLERQLKQKEDIKEIKRRLRKVEKEKEELTELIKGLYALAKEKEKEPSSHQTRATRKEIMDSILPIKVPELAGGDDEITLTEDHRRIELITEMLLSALRAPENDELVRRLRSVSGLPRSAVEKLALLFEEMEELASSLTSALADIAISSPPTDSTKTELLTIKHADSENHKT